MAVRTWFLSFVVAVVAHAAHAQYGQWTFDDGTGAVPHQIIIAQNSDLISCGDTMVRRLHHLTMVTAWATEVPGFTPLDVIEHSNGEIAAAGTYVNGSMNEIMLVVYDANGAVRWTHSYPGTSWSYEKAIGLVETQSGGFMIACAGVSPSNPAGLHGIPCAIMADVNGAELWINVYKDLASVSEQGFFRHVIRSEDAAGNALYHLTGGISVDGVGGEVSTLVVTLRDDGSVVDVAEIRNHGHSEFGRGILAADNGFYVTGYSKTAGYGSYLMRLAQDLSLEWYQSIFEFAGTRGIVRTGPNRLWLAGTLFGANPFDDAALFAIDVNTETFLAGSRFGGGAEDVVASFVAESTGFALIGRTRSFDVPTPFQYLVRADQNGLSGCNETPYVPVLQARQLDEPPLAMVGHAVAPIAQTQTAHSSLVLEMINVCAESLDCACVEPPTGMVGWWTFDEDAGTLAHDSAAHNDGVHIGSIPAVFGKVDDALVFGWGNGYVEVPCNPLLSVNGSAGTPTGSFTIDAWISLDGSSIDDGGIVEKRPFFGGPGYAFLLKNNRLKMLVSDGTTSQTASSSQVLPDTGATWTHVAVIVDRSSVPGDITFVVDGVAETFLGSVTVNGPMASAAPLWIGTSRWMDTPQGIGMPFPGALDEVEFFNRALSVSEIQAIYNAGVCGKCKLNCNPPWDAPFCADQLTVEVVIPICNRSPDPMTVELQFASLSSAACGSINGPTGFTVISPPSNFIIVPGNACVHVTVEIERPAQMTALNQVGCYELTLIDVQSGMSTTCRGSVQDRRDLCPLMPDDPVEMEIGAVALISVAVVVSEDFEAGVVEWAAVAYGEDMAPSSIFSINGAEPGSMATGMFESKAGSSVEIPLQLYAIDYAMGYQDIVLFTRTGDADNEYVPLGSFMVSIAPPTGDTPPCPADFNNDGKVDGGDLGLMLSAWGNCDACQQDLNGDGKVDGGDLGLLLAAWGDC